MKAVHIFISGFVQGIGFRYFIRKNAIDLGLKGWVRNLPAGRQGTTEGKVETLIQGGKVSVDRFIELCKKGPFLAEVKNVEVTWEEREDEFEGFEII